MLLYFLCFQGRIHCLRFLLSFIYVILSVANHLKKLLTIRSVFCYPISVILKNNRAFHIFVLKAFISKIFQK